MDMTELIQSTPISVEKSNRTEEIRAITSCKAGVIVPLHFIPMLREDSVSRGDVRLSFDMAETLYPLMNAVNVKVMAHFISFVAFDRFASGMESLNRSYQGVVEPGSTLIDFFPTMNFAKAAPFWKTLGTQWPEGTPINRAPVEAYNFLVNWRRRARTDKLPVRALTDTSLAEAFWKMTPMSDVVPDWDQSAMDGEVGLSFVNSRVSVRGIGLMGAIQTEAAHLSRETGGSVGSGVTMPGNGYLIVHGTPIAGQANLGISTGSAAAGYPDIYAELRDSGVTVSLANIELAKQTAAFAKLRERFDGLDDDHLVDLLMEGIRVPDEALKQPILLDSRSTIFGMSERKAMDGDNLDMSRTTGSTQVALRFRTPPMNTGGIILITAEIVPEQLYERRRDLFLGTTLPATLPNFLRDYLDPEKVEVVPNRFVDVHHGTPTATFGYAPLNFQWKRSMTRAGGKFYRPNPDAFVEDRTRFWSADQINPTLADDFYMVTNLPHTVFADTLSDPFEVVTLGKVNIVGNTVFGDKLTENTGSYDDVLADVDQTRIVQP